MRIFHSIVQPFVGLVFDAGHDRQLHRAIGLELIGDYYARVESCRLSIVRINRLAALVLRRL
jgi:hypothetical protein